MSPSEVAVLRYWRWNLRHHTHQASALLWSHRHSPLKVFSNFLEAQRSLKCLHSEQWAWLKPWHSNNDAAAAAAAVWGHSLGTSA